MDYMDAARIRAERARIRDEYGNLFDELSGILFTHDPIGINFETNTDEYEPEVGTILPRLTEADSPIALRRIIHEEFVRWFNGEDTAGPESSYEELAQEIWTAYQRYLSDVG